MDDGEGVLGVRIMYRMIELLVRIEQHQGSTLSPNVFVMIMHKLTA